MARGTSGPGEAPRKLPGRLVSVALPLASLLLVAIFVLILFPYARFREIAVARLAQSTGASVSLDELAGGLSIGCARVTANRLSLRWPDRRELLLERAEIRPAWSLSWMRGEPALHLDLTGPVGSATGTLWPGASLAFAGQLRGIDLALLPLDLLADPPPVLGRVDAEIDLRQGSTGPIGSIRFVSSDGSIALPDLPFGIPFQQARGELRRSDSGAITVRGFELSGPMLAASLEGTIAPSGRRDEGALDLQGELTAADPALRSMIQPYGFRFDSTGAARFRVSGTVSRPVLRQR
jgi:type II secretion system protein N